MAARDFIALMATQTLAYLLVGTQWQILFCRPGFNEMGTWRTLAFVQPERLPSSDCLLGSDLPSNVQTHMYQTGFYVKTNISGIFKSPLRCLFNTDRQRSVGTKGVKAVQGYILFHWFSFGKNVKSQQRRNLPVIRLKMYFNAL